MIDENATTLESYQNAIHTYMAITPNNVKEAYEVNGDWESFLDVVLKDLPLDATVFEIGSGAGRDARYMLEKGYNPIFSDATQAFVEHLNATAIKAIHYNLLTDDFVSSYDLIFANAVLLHFKRADVPLVINKIYNALTKNGRFAFSLKAGDGEEWATKKLGLPLFACYWQESDITKVLLDAGFAKINIKHVQSEYNQRHWLQIICDK